MAYHPHDESATHHELEKSIGIAIRDIGIPPRPSVLIEIETEMRKDEPDFSHLAKIISADVALSAGLLKTCNSPFYGLDKKVRSVPEALLVLGLNLTIRTVAGVALRKAFERAPQLERFWDESGATARVSGWLARRLCKCCWVRPEDAYTFGLFHDCGIPILLSPFPQYRTVLAEANSDRTRKFTDIEDQLLGCNHADMGALLAETWSLPPEIVDAVRHHHNLTALVDGTIPTASSIVPPLIAITQLAEYLIYTRTGAGATFEWEKASVAVMKVLSIDESKIAELYEECHEPISGLYD